MRGPGRWIESQEAVYLYAPAYQLTGLKQASSSLATMDVMSQGIQGPPVGNAGAFDELPMPYWAAH